MARRWRLASLGEGGGGLEEEEAEGVEEEEEEDGSECGEVEKRKGRPEAGGSKKTWCCTYE